MAKKYNHLHKLKKLTLSGSKGFAKTKLYRCLIPGCTYQVPVKLAENLMIQCGRCEQPMVLDKLALELVSPHCRDCVKPKDIKRAEELGTIDQFLKEKLG